MSMMSGIKPYIPKLLPLVLLGGLLTTACTETRYVEYNEADKQEEFPFKMVAYEIDPSFYNKFPNCVLILPPGPKAGITWELSHIIETALARHFERRFDRVIDGLERQISVQRHSVDLETTGGQRILAQKLNCEAVLITKVLDPRIDYLLIWSQVGVGLELQLRNSNDDQLLWRARHKARRSEGGLSLSPIGAMVDTVVSTRFAADRDVAEGVVDDAIRRMVYPLPNMRSF